MLLHTDRKADSYVLLEREEYLQAMNGRKLSTYELPKPDPTLLQLKFSGTKAREAEQMPAAWEEFQAALSNVN